MERFEKDKFYEHESKLFGLHVLDYLDTSDIYNDGVICELFAVNGRYEIQPVDNNKCSEFTLIDKEIFFDKYIDKGGK